ncbi:MAG: arginine--tRNA ligase [bacterium]
MGIIMYSIKDYLSKKVFEFLGEEKKGVEVTKSPIDGFHYASNVLYLAKIDEEKFVDFLRQDDLIREAEIVKKFVNIKLNKMEALKRVYESYRVNNWDSFDLGRGKKVLIEFVSANPTGPLNAVNGRSATFGSVLANVLKYFNYDVFKEYYVNDVGEQVEKLVDSFIERIKEIKGLDYSIPEGGYKGEYLRDIAKLYLSQNSVEDINAIDRQQVKNFLTEYFIESHKKTLANFGVEFDNWFRQSFIKDEDLINTFENLGKKGLIYENEGALYFRSTIFGDDKDRVVKKTVGKVDYTYFAYDMEYIRNKFSRGFERLITILGPDHHGYVSRLIAATKALGYEDHEIIILQIVNVLEKDKLLKMSKRRGVIVLLDELMEKVNPMFLRYFFISRLKDSPLDLDIEFINRLTVDNPLYYIFYAYARICGVIRNYGKKLPDFEEIMDIEMEDEEFELFLAAQEFRDYLFYALNDPYYLTLWAFNFAKIFHRFYNSNKIICASELGDKREKIRMFLIIFSKGILEKWANILGIELPEKM